MTSTSNHTHCVYTYQVLWSKTTYSKPSGRGGKPRARRPNYKTDYKPLVPVACPPCAAPSPPRPCSLDSPLAKHAISVECASRWCASSRWCAAALVRIKCARAQVELAKTGGWDVLATNAPRRYVSLVGREGLQVTG